MKDDRWGQVSRLFHAARALDPGARMRFLAAECRGDESLRSEVESLLEQSDGPSRPPSTELTAASPLVGRQIASYRIEALIGAGGMGQVYRARDLKLGRDVALKVLPPELTSEQERLTRFEREARVLAALNHPNIATIHGIEETDGVRAIVMELIDGETLAARIERGPIPLAEALAIARHVVDALDAAHEKGIVHRDLKPANIAIGPNQAVKVLDFGLAKLDTSADASGGGIVKSQAPTVTVDGTLAGRLLGTAAYMSPEQVRGLAVDKRADIWAFGCVLYEMLTGRRAFARETMSDTLSAILEREPDLTALPAATPPGVRRLLERCLEREARERLRDIGDARPELTVPTRPHRAGLSGEAAARSRWRMVALIGASVIAAVTAFFAGRWASPLRPSSESSAVSAPISFPVETPAGTFPPIEQGGTSPPAVSPDGQAIASVLRGPDGMQRIWIQRLDGSPSNELKGTEGATYPFWSHDGHALGFIAQSKLKRINESGNGLRELADTNEVSLGGTWNANDVIVYSSRYGLNQISDDVGSTPRRVVELDTSNQEDSLRFPHFLPDGRHFLFVARSGRPSNSAAYVGNLDGQRVRLFETHSSVVYSPPGYLMYLRGRTLVARQFDADTLTLGSDEFDVATDVGGNALSMMAAVGVSRNGGVLAYSRFKIPLQKLQWVDRKGTPVDTLLEPASITQFKIAPDGKRVVAALQDFSAGTRNLWIFEAERSPRRLTFVGTHDWEPIWSPDGSRVAFSSYRDGPLNLYVKAADSSGSDEPLFMSSFQKDATDWSRDGRWFSYRGIGETTRSDVSILPLSGERKPIAIAAGPGQERDGRFSPDSRWIAYESDENGSYDIYVQPVPPTGAKHQVSYGGGNAPTWNGDGRELFFVADGWLNAVPVDTAGAFQIVGRPTRLFAIAASQSLLPVNTWYDVSRNGQRFLVNVPLPQPPAGPIHILLNWPARINQAQR